VIWRKLGLLYAPSGERPWAQSHAMIPTPLALSADLIRLYVAHTDANTVGRIGWLDVRLSDPTSVVDCSPLPILDIGAPGDFDDNGVCPCSAVCVDEGIRLFYVGFQLQTKIPYTIFTGLATAERPNGPFQRERQLPVLDRAEDQRFVRSGPCVMHDGGRWRMWYIGGSSWVWGAEKQLPSYSLRYLESEDGATWNGRGTELMTPDGPDEIGFGRPYVVRSDSGYRMWYSVRTRAGYTLGYATSPDGLQWTRRDQEAGIGPSESGWDSEMICYAAIVPGERSWTMFYNGNGYGRSGVGVAVAQPD
jgi:hypothetical protein